MGRHQLKGILLVTKSVKRNKRVTFNDDVTLNEFKANSVISKTKPATSSSECDVTLLNRVDDEITSIRNHSEENDTKFDDNDQRNNAQRKKDYDEGGEISTSVKNGNSESTPTALNEPTSAVDIISFKRAIDRVEMAAIDVEVPVTTETEQSQTEASDNITEGNKACEVQENSDEHVTHNIEASSTDDMNSKTEKGGKNEDNSMKTSQKNLKKQSSANCMNLPSIREELHSRMSDVTIHDRDVKSDEYNSPNTQSTNVSETNEKPLSPLTTDDVIQRAREDAKLSALRGQIPADKAAWSCVVRYPRHTLSQPGNGRASPLTPDVIHAAAKSPIPLIEKRNPFLLCNSPPLALYKPKFGPRKNTTMQTLPPLATPTRNSQSGLVTQNGMWVPDTSIVCKSRRRRVTVKGSNVTIREINR